jgi:Flp pilus assembly protein CpaB
MTSEEKNMRGGSKLFIFAGVGLGLVAILLIIASMGGDKTDAQSSGSKKITVVQAANDVPAHSILLPEDLVTKEVASDQVPPDAVRTIGEVVGKSYRISLTSTQTLVASQVEQPGLRNDVAVGKRAIAVPVDQKNLFAGLIQDGDFIDVIFHARVNEVRLLPTNFADTPEDEPYYKYSSDKQNTDNSNNGDQNNNQQDDQGAINSTSSGDSIMWVPPGVEIPQHPAVGDAGSQLFIRDDISDQQQLEPLAKVMVQDARVLRVVRPGEAYGADGTINDEAAGALGNSSAETPVDGYIVVEVSLAQAEVLTFMQDEKHDYQVVVRGKDDHEQVSTNGVTFEILYQDGKYDLPLPGSVTVSSKKK